MPLSPRVARLGRFTRSARIPIARSITRRRPAAQAPAMRSSRPSRKSAAARKPSPTQLVCVCCRLLAGAVPVRLVKRDLLFVAERMVSLLDENRVAILARQHGIKKTKENESIGKPFMVFLRRAEESTLGRTVVEAAILLTASRGNASQALRDAATAYKVDTEAISARSSRSSRRRRRQRPRRKPHPRRNRKPPRKRQRHNRPIN